MDEKSIASIMTQKEKDLVERWAKYIIPAVFQAENDLQLLHPEWIEKLKSVNDENVQAVAREYCEAIAKLIVKPKKEM